LGNHKEHTLKLQTFEVETDRGMAFTTIENEYGIKVFKELAIQHTEVNNINNRVIGLNLNVV